MAAPCSSQSRGTRTRCVTSGPLGTSEAPVMRPSLATILQTSVIPRAPAPRNVGGGADRRTFQPKAQRKNLQGELELLGLAGRREHHLCREGLRPEPPTEGHL